MAESHPFTCPICGAVSHHIHDVLNRYCERCNVFTHDEGQIYGALVRGKLKPDPTLYQAGWDAHAAGKQCYEGPKPHHSVAGLRWRMGWNGRALEVRAEPDPGRASDA